jgi:hypothetical protein
MGWRRRCQALSHGGGRALPCLVKMFQHQRIASSNAVASIGRDTLHAMLVRAGPWAAVCGLDGVWPGVVECGRVKCA